LAIVIFKEIDFSIKLVKTMKNIFCFAKLTGCAICYYKNIAGILHSISARLKKVFFTDMAFGTRLYNCICFCQIKTI